MTAARSTGISPRAESKIPRTSIFWQEACAVQKRKAKVSGDHAFGKECRTALPEYQLEGNSDSNHQGQSACAALRKLRLL